MEQDAQEKLFQVDGNYPTLILISNTKNVFSKQLGTLNEKDVADFVWQMKNRPKGLVEYTPVPLVKATKWDGKDVEVAQGDEIDEDFLKDIIGNSDL